MNYQHRTPQRDLDHKVTARVVVETTPSGRMRKYHVCRSCGKAVIPSPPNDGPEMLKALLRF